MVAVPSRVRRARRGLRLLIRSAWTAAGAVGHACRHRASDPASGLVAMSPGHLPRMSCSLVTIGGSPRGCQGTRALRLHRCIPGIRDPAGRPSASLGGRQRTRPGMLTRIRWEQRAVPAVPGRAARGRGCPADVPQVPPGRGRLVTAERLPRRRRAHGVCRQDVQRAAWPVPRSSCGARPPAMPSARRPRPAARARSASPPRAVRSAGR